MQINSVELNVQFTNADFVERYENAVEKLQKKSMDIPKDSWSKAIRYQIATVKEYVDEIFGDGSYASIHLNPDDLDEHLNIIEEISKEFIAQKTSFTQRMNQYKPNRSQRRTKK